jgi:surface protein
LAAFIQAENADNLVNKVVNVTGSPDVIFEFEAFYAISAKQKVFIAKSKKKPKNALRAALEEWAFDKVAAFAKYGHISFWDVSLVTDMSKLFHSLILSINDDLSRWNVSQVTTMHRMIFTIRDFKET